MGDVSSLLIEMRTVSVGGLLSFSKNVKTW